MEAVVMICADIKPAKKALELLDPVRSQEALL